MSQTQRGWRTNRTVVTWAGAAVAVGSTIVLFVGAYASMVTVLARDRALAAPAEGVAIVTLRPPMAPPTVPLEPRRARAVRHTAATSPNEAAPTPVRFPEAQHDLAPVDSSRERRDVSSPSSSVAVRDTMTAPLARSRAVGPVATPLAVNAIARELTPAARDSMLRLRMEALASLARDYHMTEAQKAELEAQREPGRLPSDGAMYSTGQRPASPILSGGSLAIVDLLWPMGPRRSRDSVIDADNRARLARLQLIMEQRRRLAAAESLRVKTVSTAGSRSDSTRLRVRDP